MFDHSQLRQRTRLAGRKVAMQSRAAQLALPPAVEFFMSQIYSFRRCRRSSDELDTNWLRQNVGATIARKEFKLCMRRAGSYSVQRKGLLEHALGVHDLVAQPARKADAAKSTPLRIARNRKLSVLLRTSVRSHTWTFEI